MVNANSVKFLKKGNMPTKKLELPNSLGYIKPTKKTISTEDHTNFQIFDCLFAKDKNHPIRYYDETNGEYIDLDRYQRKFDFHIFYNPSRNMLILDTNATIVKSFFKILKNLEEDQRIEVKTYKLDYEFIDQIFKTARTIRFKSSDQGVNSKTFSGNEVTINQETIKAIKRDNVTSIIGVLDVKGQACTVSISKTGSIACYSSLPKALFNTGIDYPLLEFTVEVLKSLNLIN